MKLINTGLVLLLSLLPVTMAACKESLPEDEQDVQGKRKMNLVVFLLKY